MVIRIASTLVLINALMAAPCASAQCPAPAWVSVNDQIPGFDNGVNAVTSWDPDGPGPASPVLAAGGGFAFAGGVPANRVATWDGTSWQSPSTGMDNYVFALTPYNGELVAGGLFWAAGGTLASGVARWNGVSWQPFGVGVNFGVWALAEFNGNLVAAGGYLGNFVTPNIAVWSAASSSWQFLPHPNDQVTSLAVFNGELIAGGYFISVGGLAANYIARWNGTFWQQLGTGMNGVVRALTVFNGELIAGGDFTDAGGTAASKIARWNGSSWLALGSGTDGSVSALGVHNGDLIAGGTLQVAGGISAKSIARWDGSAWYPLGSGINGFVSALVHHNGELVAGGYFTTAGGVLANDAARWDGSSWQPLGSGAINGAVFAMTDYAGDVVVGGSTDGVTRWNGGASQQVGFGPSWVTSLIVYNTELIAGGYFPLVNGAPTNHVTRWVGSAWAPLGLGMGGNGCGVMALHLYNGDLIAGGEFVSAGGVPANNIARWDGASWSPLGSGVTGPPITNWCYDGPVRALAVYNGDLLAAGHFTTAGGVAANNIARWNGSSWNPLGAGTNGSVSALIVHGGELFAGGNFSMAGNIPASRIARWNGTAWGPCGTGMSNPCYSAINVRAFAVFEGELIAGGDFDTAGGVTAHKIARWNGSVWQPVGAGISGCSSFVSALHVYDGALLAGGYFFTAGGLVSPFLARWSTPLPLLSVTQSGGFGSAVEVTNRWLIPSHEYFNVASLTLCPGGPGTGPYGGLCFDDPSQLVQQLVLPIGTHPFHFVASGVDATFGPYPLPAGLAFEAISVDVTGGVVGCISPVTRYSVYLGRNLSGSLSFAGR